MKVKIDKNGVVSIGKKLEALAKPITRSVAAQLGEAVRSEMLDQISKGVSPIKGNGRFPRYKDAKKYPGDRKPRTPVNLKLTGQFLDSFKTGTFPTKTGYGSTIEIKGSGSYGNREIAFADIEQGHREGANGQPKRPTLPIKARGETFSARIIRIIRDIYNEAISSIVRR